MGEPVSLGRFCAYFLRLGAVGFGGPIALAGAMQRDLVEERRWIDREDYVQGLALAQLAPGPLAAQLAIYLGWIRGRVAGLVLLAGALAVVVKAPPRAPGPPSAAILGLSPALFSGLRGAADADFLLRIFLFFAKAGTFVFGSGLAIVPFLYGGVVKELGWLSERQFLDAVAVAMITPGPVVITVAFIGYLVAGFAGATAAALGVFLPVWFFVVLPAPYVRRLAARPSVTAFVLGVTAAATGALAGAAVVIARGAIRDLPTALIAVSAFLIVWKTKTPEPFVVAAAGGLGLLLFRG